MAVRQAVTRLGLENAPPNGGRAPYAIRRIKVTALAGLLAMTSVVPKITP